MSSDNEVTGGEAEEVEAMESSAPRIEWGACRDSLGRVGGQMRGGKFASSALTGHVAPRRSLRDSIWVITRATPTHTTGDLPHHRGSYLPQVFNASAN